LKDPDTDLVVGLAVADVYITYSSAVTERERDELRSGCGRAWKLLREAGPGNCYAAPGDRTELEELSREGKIASVREYLDFFPFVRVRDGPLTISDDLFIECLVNGIKNETISYQTFIKKNTNKNRSALLKKIEALKSEGINFDNRLLELESLLNKQLDLELRAEIENLSSYEYLNDEKITPYFVSLAKNNKATASTDTICDDNGNAFINAADRNQYVREFYA
jgi:hypothetical protein